MKGIIAFLGNVLPMLVSQSVTYVGVLDQKDHHRDHRGHREEKKNPLSLSVPSVISVVVYASLPLQLY